MVSLQGCLPANKPKGEHYLLVLLNRNWSQHRLTPNWTAKYQQGWLCSLMPSLAHGWLQSLLDHS